MTPNYLQQGNGTDTGALRVLILAVYYHLKENTGLEKSSPGDDTESKI